jgi:hypothetical protein
VELINLDMV